MGRFEMRGRARKEQGCGHLARRSVLSKRGGATQKPGRSGTSGTRSMPRRPALRPRMAQLRCTFAAKRNSASPSRRNLRVRFGGTIKLATWLAMAKPSTDRP